MPLHDWTKVPAGLFHDFHQTWTIQLKMALNSGLLPDGLSALVEQRSGTRESDVLTVESREDWRDNLSSSPALMMERPKTQFTFKNDNAFYTSRANRVVVKHHLGQTVAIIEVVSPGNKDSRAAIRQFVDKTIDFLRLGVHVLILDLFPPGKRDPNGLHQLIWDEIHEEPFSFPPGRDRLLASYQASDELTAYLETLCVGDTLPIMPLYLWDEGHVRVPLETTYTAAWQACPREVQRLLVSVD